MHALDSRIVNPEARNPSTVAMLEGRLRESSLQLQSTLEIHEKSVTDAESIKQRIHELESMLRPVHAFWKRIDAPRIVNNKPHVSAEERVNFMGQREAAMSLLFELELKEKEIAQKGKQLAEVKARVKQIQKLKMCKGLLRIEQCMFWNTS